MTVKQSKQATKDQELTSIEEKLLKCAETKKPVLLYGKDAIGRKELVLKVHKEIGGIDRKYIDCGTKSGKEVYKLLVGIAIRCTEPPDEDGGFNSGSCYEEDTNKGLLFECKGALFVDSLHYDSKDEDNKYYRKLAEIIKKGINVNWLVAYTYDLESLPAYFREQFEVIGLEPEKQDKTTGTPKKINKLFYSWNEENKFVLYSKKDKPVELTKQESELILFLKEDRRTQEEIIERIWEVCKPIYIKKKKSNLGEIRRRINTKCWEPVAKDLISELTDGCYRLNVDIEEQ